MIERNIHHACRIPARTCIAAPNWCDVSKGWHPRFETWHGIPGSERLATRVESGWSFKTEDEAYKAAGRALDVLQETGAFPNLCEPY